MDKATSSPSFGRRRDFYGKKLDYHTVGVDFGRAMSDGRTMGAQWARDERFNDNERQSTSPATQLSACNGGANRRERYCRTTGAITMET